jgi:hypothetical protein
MVVPPSLLESRREVAQFEIDPIGIDAIIDILARLNPVAVDITGIRLLCTEAAVNVNLLNAGRPKSLDGKLPRNK